jgi:hypothetical protein
LTVSVGASLAVTTTKRWPTLRLVDWDGYSHAHPDWFADDGLGVHLTVAGRTAYGTFLRDQLDDLPGIGVRPPAAQHCASSVAIGRTVQSLAVGTPLAPTSGLFSARTPLRVLDTRAGRPLVRAGDRVQIVAGPACPPARPPPF